MSKKINGNKLIIALSDWWYSSFGLEETEESKAIQKVLDAVERYVDHEKSADDWIPCSERLPKTGDSILVTYSDGEVGIVWDARPEVWGAYEKATNLIFPIAWMPLPKPYREDDEA